MQKLLVAGGTGFVGGHLVRRARGRWEVVVLSRQPRAGAGAERVLAVDVTDREAVLAAIAAEGPAAVVDAAAVANIDYAERHPEEARRVNAEAAGHLAEGCRRAGARYLYLSSDAVFAGTADGYAEEDEPAPLNVYGRTKAEGERAALAGNPDTAVVRVSLVLGWPVAGGNSFYVPLQRQLARGEEVAVTPEEIRTPVDAGTLAEAVLELAGGGHRGALHIGSTDSVSRWELTRRIARAMGFDPALVRAEDGAGSGGSRPGAAPPQRHPPGGEGAAPAADGTGGRRRVRAPLRRGPSLKN